MKNKLHYFILLFVLAALTGCNEKLSIETEIQGAPEISEFTPTSGKAGTEITVKGSNLRDIVSATIGGVESQILYKLSQQEIVIVVPREGTKSGKIVLATSRKDDAGESTRAESAQSFSVTYPTPRVTDFPKGGRVGNNVEILGADLDIISKVFMGDEEGEIIYQSEKEIAVKVPFIIDDEATVSLKYANQTGGESEIKGESGDFIVEKDEPEIEKIDQESLMERSLLTLGGKNLNLIEYIYFGEEKYAPVSQNGSTIVFRVPTLPETRTVKIKVTYYRETKEIILSDACEVIRMKNLFSANQAIGTRNSKYGYGSMLNGNSADGNPICTPCVLKEEENFDKILKSGYIAENYRKMELDEKKGFDSLYFMELKISADELKTQVAKIMQDPECGGIFRVKGFVKDDAGSWMQLNATGHEISMKPIGDGQEVVIVIGEQLKEDSIRKYLEN